MFKEFKEFIARGNVIDLAVAVIIGAAFGKIITSLVDGIIMPPIGRALGKVDFASLFYVLDHSKGEPVSLADAKAKGIPVIAYGVFIRAVNRMKGPKAPDETKECPHCLTKIPLKATRCSGCCAQL